MGGFSASLLHFVRGVNVENNPAGVLGSCSRRAFCRKIDTRARVHLSLHTCVSHAALAPGAAPGTGSLPAGARSAFLVAGSGAGRGLPPGFRPGTGLCGAAPGAERPLDPAGRAPRPELARAERLHSSAGAATPAPLCARVSRRARGRCSVGARTAVPTQPSPPRLPLATRVASAARGPRLPWLHELWFRARGGLRGPSRGLRGPPRCAAEGAMFPVGVRPRGAARAESARSRPARAGAVVAGKVCAPISALWLRFQPGRARGCRASRAAQPCVAASLDPGPSAGCPRWPCPAGTWRPHCEAREHAPSPPPPGRARCAQSVQATGLRGSSRGGRGRPGSRTQVRAWPGRLHAGLSARCQLEKARGGRRCQKLGLQGAPGKLAFLLLRAKEPG